MGRNAWGQQREGLSLVKNTEKQQKRWNKIATVKLDSDRKEKGIWKNKRECIVRIDVSPFKS